MQPIQPTQPTQPTQPGATDNNLLDVIGRDTRLKRVAATRGGEYAGPCPLCGGTDRFRVWPNHEGGRWWCRGCERSGDLVAYLVETGRIDKREAYRRRHGAMVAPVASVARVAHIERDPATPPNQTWQARAWAFVAQSQAELWSATGGRALAWLRGRGLTDTTIKRGGLGYNPRDSWEDRDRWGFEDAGKRVWLPRGVVMPWFIGRDLWRVNIRRPVRAGEKPKCIGPAGYSQGLYESDRIRSDKPAILLEGELDALTVLQEAGDLVAPVATGGTISGRRSRWVAKLALCPLVLVAFDNDEHGEDARRWWLDALGNGRYWRPYWGDANDLHQDGANVRQWVQTGLGIGSDLL